MEHLHPDDARKQLGNIYDSLKPGGNYICITPSRYSGPHDVSKCFDDTAAGFHFKEYTVRYLGNMFKEVGFSKILIYAGGKGVYLRCPVFLSGILEVVLNLFPGKLRRSLVR